MRRRQNIHFQGLRSQLRHSIPAALLLLAISVSQIRATTVLAFIGDEASPNVASEGAASVANMVANSSWQTDYVITLGDNNGGVATTGSPDWDQVLGVRYGQFMKARTGPGPNPYPNQTSAVQRFFPVVGDHDRDPAGPAGLVSGYIDYFHTDPGNPAGRLPAGVHNATQSYYAFTLPIEGGTGSVRIFAMDSEAFAYSQASQAAQVAWLRDGLRSSTATWNFVTLHSPPFSSGPHNSNPLYQLPFQQWGADAVLAGHDHLYERLRVTDAEQNQMLYFVNGLAGSGIYPFRQRATGSERRYNDTHGAIRVTVTDEEAMFEFLVLEPSEDGSNGGTLFDSITLLQANLPTPPVLTADFNDDGFVDGDDLSIWKSAFAENDLADADGDDDSDGDDFLIWQRQRSNFQPFHPTTIVPIPEPATGTCFAILVGAAPFCRWRRGGA